MRRACPRRWHRSRAGWPSGCEPDAGLGIVRRGPAARACRVARAARHGHGRWYGCCGLARSAAKRAGRGGAVGVMIARRALCVGLAAGAMAAAPVRAQHVSKPWPAGRVLPPLAGADLQGHPGAVRRYAHAAEVLRLEQVPALAGLEIVDEERPVGLRDGPAPGQQPAVAPAILRQASRGDARAPDEGSQSMPRTRPARSGSRRQCGDCGQNLSAGHTGFQRQ